MAPDLFTTLARVVKTHGLDGEVAVEPAAGLPAAYPEGIEVWFVPPPLHGRSGVIEGVRQGSRGPLVRLHGIEDVEAASTLVGKHLVVRTTDLPASFFESAAAEEPDPVGLRISDATHGVLGEVVDVIVTGANDVWVVDGPLGEVLLPVIDECVRSVDWEARTAEVSLLPGLLPDEAGR